MEIEVLNQGRRHGNWRRPGLRRGVLALLAVAVIYGLLSLGQWWLARPDPVVEESAEIGWQPASATRDLARDVFDRTNAERQARGLEPLQWSDDLGALAEQWAEQMIREGFGRPPEGFAPTPRSLSENVAWGQTDTAELHLGWMAEDLPRTQLLWNRFTTTGVGIACRNDGVMWAVQFFRTDGPAVALPADPPPGQPVVGDHTGMRCPAP